MNNNVMQMQVELNIEILFVNMVLKKKVKKNKSEKTLFLASLENGQNKIYFEIVQGTTYET